jgi:hypothetical protein
MNCGVPRVSAILERGMAAANWMETLILERHA